ncbi:helix-turn-helix domain-containing protein [Nostoc punctiforme FACHB-252]|uniref:Helix-turn-helix domain-containing protein n=1 Tax=Nostoc punctiforme FACHB-252 TaxID=1357509 RepID=A0ABR8HKZ2_NOSPU|nr:helix-turn-helix transcriptional regulator [Nostoc punctiforme]MBD2616509.1 helix-turn-helix domain-containing protein [Nostoc punctiforme FACHB-252]
MSQELNKLGSFLASVRQHQKLTLRAVETQTGISNAYLSQLETGKIRSPSPAILRKLSDFYGISYISILELAGYPVPEAGKLDTSLTDLAARLGPVTSEEADELANYLKYLRSKQNKRKI